MAGHSCSLRDYQTITALTVSLFFALFLLNFLLILDFSGRRRHYFYRVSGLKRNKGFLAMPAIADNETAFAELLRPYENLWVAIIEKDGVEFVVGNGSTAVEAINLAREHGYPQPRLFRVPSFDLRLVY
jgi:hypothetical protein